MKLLGLLVIVLGVFAPIRAEIQFEERTLMFDGLERRFLLYVPSGYDGTQVVPLVFMLHGGGGSPEIYEPMTGMGEKAEAEGFILVYPAGTGRHDSLLTWNSGDCCAYALENNIDDVGFFREMVATLTDEFKIDPNRIFAAGHSNGGMMSYRLAAEMSDVFAAVAVVAGTIGGYPTPESNELYMIPQPEHPVSVLHIHGMEDTQVRYQGGVNDPASPSRRNDLSVADSIGFWVEANQCETTPTHEVSAENMVIVDTYDCSTTAVKLISIVDGGHAFPGGTTPRRRADAPSQRVSATDEIWAFFSEHPR